MNQYRVTMNAPTIGNPAGYFSARDENHAKEQACRYFAAPSERILSVELIDENGDVRNPSGLVEDIPDDDSANQRPVRG